MTSGSRTVLVTGGAGYIASHCIVELLNEGYQVVAVDNFANAVEDPQASGFPESLKRVEQITGKKCIFHKADMNDTQALNAIFQKHEIYCIIHCAALKAVGESVQKPLEYYKSNVGGSINLLMVARNAGVKRFVFSSSATVYGNPQYLPIDEKHPVGVGITNPYGQTKYMVEVILQDLHKSDAAWDIILLRYFNPVGSHESGRIGEDPQGPPNNLMPFVAQVAVGRQPELKVFGSDYDTKDGTGVRDYIHVVDLAKGHVAALKKFEKSFGLKVYNLGTGQGYSVLEMVEAFKKASGRDIQYRKVDRRGGDVPTVYGSAALAEKELNWKCEKGLDDMCRDLWRWQEQNPKGFANK
ncbi:UDP-glucose 4-epimerase-like [Paramacrobiotus metropolitanus]|uniref:UDP-glucose 4-epimerase-like n=1 Tax=Paramacrobiotus metropolitanus TaxID=2943436 RepID=UPI0024458985|nr:UDP-glucose 4-epimerase-like [Paramacrobiotus metropolitanus]